MKFSDLARQAAQIEIDEIEHAEHHETKKREVWEKMGSSLEAQGYPPSTISRKIKATVELICQEKGFELSISNGYYYHIMSQHGWNDPNMGPRSQTTPREESRNTSYIMPNEACVRSIRTIKQTCNLIEDGFLNLKDRKGKNIELKEVVGDAQLTSFLKEFEKIGSIAANAANAKTKVPPNTHALFKRCLEVEAGLINAAKLFLQTKLVMLDNIRVFITKKQAQKFERGSEPAQISIFKPKDRDEAIFLSWYGIQCKCGSWRVREHTSSTRNNLQCIDCNLEFEGYTLTHCSGLGSCGKIWYLEELRHIVKNKKCPACGKAVKQIPSHIKEYSRTR